MRKHVLFILLLLLAVLVGVSGCGSSKTSSSTSTGAKTETRSVSHFTAINLTSIGTLTVEQARKDSLTITADSAILPLITSTVADDTLTLSVKAGASLGTPTQLSYKVTVKDLKALSLTGAGAILATDINTTALAVSMNGVGKMTISGQADNQTVNISGAATYDGTTFATKTTTASITGVSHVIVRVSNTLNARVNGLGTIEYIGSPQLTQTIQGGGAVRKITG